MKKKSSILVNTLVLFAVTFVAVLALAVVNQITREPIAQAEINARAEVYRLVFPDAENFSEFENSESLIENSAVMLEKAGYKGCFINDALAVKNGDSIVGYVIAATSPNGYGGDLQVALGITTDGIIKGFNIVSHGETAGLGSKCTEPDFTSQFANKPAVLLEYTKTGAVADNEIDAISGATISTNAATEAANAAIVFYQENFASDNINQKGE
ncbi:MAG: RnfABCDGE type electron transport complex subunit G [Eubacterium sp.]|nr:RnfABCDGE type electron transport complex subunit G [Eubacterium sp.]